MAQDSGRGLGRGCRVRKDGGITVWAYPVRWKSRQDGVWGFDGAPGILSCKQENLKLLLWVYAGDDNVQGVRPYVIWRVLKASEMQGGGAHRTKEVGTQVPRSSMNMKRPQTGRKCHQWEKYRTVFVQTWAL